MSSHLHELDDVSFKLLSESASKRLKSALLTPTMMIDRGRTEAALMACCVINYLGHLTNDWRKIGWTIQLNNFRCSLIRGQDMFNASDVWVGRCQTEVKVLR